MVPLWSSVELKQPNSQLLAELERMKEKSEAAPLAQRVAALRSQVEELLSKEEINEAYEITREALPDARISIQPLITWRTMNSTPYATANATLRVLTAALSDNWLPVHGQVLLSGQCLDIRGVCGIPVELNRQGWRVGNADYLTSDDRARLKQAAAAIEEYLANVLAG
jgi:malate dehydrogenase